MKVRTGDNSENIEVTNQWYRTAVNTAIIGGAFSLFVLTLIVTNYFRLSVSLPKLEENLENLKLEIRTRPDDKQLLQRIRQLDLEIREDRIRRQHFSRKGSYVLLGSLALLLIGAKCAATFKKKLPAPRQREDKWDRQVREATCARWAVSGGLVILGSAALFLATRPRIDFSAADAGTTLYPSMEEISKNWPRFRGPGGLGISAYTNIPVKWNGKTNEGIIWKSKVPLAGHNSPVVWDDRVFVSGANRNTREVYCFDASSGRLLWTGDVQSASPRTSKRLEVTKETGFAAPTAVTDGRHVCAIFANGDVGCFDFAGRKVWAINLGVPDNTYGHASSLAMYRNLLLIQYDQASVEDEKSKLIALNAFSGDTVWEMKRPVSSSWASPIVADMNDKPQLIACSDPWAIAYNPTNGAELWRAECLGGEIAPSPIYAGGLIFAVEPYAKLVAIKPDGHGDVTKTHIAWSIEDIAPDICCPVSNGKLIFLLATEGFLACYKTKDGTKLWEKEMDNDFLASPSLVGDNLYLLTREGVMIIVKAGAEYRELTRCELGETCYASPAFADGRIYIRGVENLYCIGNKD